MATLNLGRIKPVFRGAYAGGTAYVVDDIVTSGGETFICIQASTGNATSNATYWTKLAEKGLDGTNVATTLTTQGDILYRDGSGLQRLPKGTAGQVLQMNSGATAPEYGTISSEMVELAHGQITSSTASINIDVPFNDTTYMAYKMIGTYKATANSNFLKVRIRQAGSTKTDAHYNGAIDYAYRQLGTSSAASYGAYENNDHMRISDWKNNSADDFRYFEMFMGNYMQDTQSSTGKPLGFQHFGGQHTSSYYPSGEHASYYYKGNAAAITGFHFFLSSDNFASADFKFYGMKR